MGFQSCLFVNRLKIRAPPSNAFFEYNQNILRQVQVLEDERIALIWNAPYRFFIPFQGELIHFQNGISLSLDEFPKNLGTWLVRFRSLHASSIAAAISGF